MSKRYEVAMKITDTTLIDQAILFLVYNGYNVYLDNEDKSDVQLCFGTTDEEITETDYEKTKK